MPSSVNYVRNYKQEARTESPVRRKKRNMRNKARRMAVKSGKAKKGDGKDVHHVDRNPSNLTASNLKVMNKSKNRSRNA